MILNFKPSTKQLQAKKQDMLVLAGDIGGTKTNLALFKASGDEIVPLHNNSYHTSDFSSLIELLALFLKDIPDPHKICLGVAGPVLKGHAKLSNIKWEIDQKELKKHFKKDFSIINDLEATAYGLAMLNEFETVVIHQGKDQISGNAAVIAPGTGLGEAGIYWDGRFYHPFATEGGHADFASRNAQDFDLFLYLQKQFGHVSWERVLSGPGIIQIYQFLVHEVKREESAFIKEKFKNGYDASIISQNNEKCPLCKETMQLFIRFLAFESANLVLKHNATGGLFIGGGIAPSILNLFKEYDFNRFFCQSGRLNDLIENVTVRVILNTKAALLGAAWFGFNHD
ncbi:glucokinase [Daejeonella sp.]|uniref:glucokinase n=1 Tax=Daejeonella sp. TaxID=2805397 RepID=UPI0025B93365|nr:glucokinase [Daejeonella sp.]